MSDWQSFLENADMADWLTVAAYLLAAFFSTQAAGLAGLRRQARDEIFWRITAVLLVFLAVNELLDLQTLLTSLGREHAKVNGWYGEHRKVQYVFVMALGGAAVLASIAMLWLTRGTNVAVRLALIGLIYIGVFVLLRAASFHRLDRILGGGAPEFNWGSLQEMSGILIVGAAAVLYRGEAKRRQ